MKFFNKAERKVSVNEIVRELDCAYISDGEGILIKRKYIYKGQEMGRLRVMPLKNHKVAVVDGWGSRMAMMEVSKLKGYLKELFGGSHVWYGMEKYA